MVRTPCFHSRSTESVPSQRTKIPTCHEVWPKKKKKKEKKFTPIFSSFAKDRFPKVKITGSRHLKALDPYIAKLFSKEVLLISVSTVISNHEIIREVPPTLNSFPDMCGSLFPFSLSRTK